MREWRMYRDVHIALLMVGLTLQASPIAWAQLQDVDPALDAAVGALIATDPEIANNPELAQLCRQIAEATVVDPRERAAVTGEVTAIHREGVDLNTIISTEVREAAREQFSQVQGQMRERLEVLRASDPEKAREVELMMREGERQMQAFETGEHYSPSPEMVAHAEGMMRDWETEMTAQGAPPEYIERARTEFAAWSSGEMTEVMGMMGPGHEFSGPGGMPTPEQMQAMVDGGQMTPEQFQMAQEYMSSGGNFEAFGPGPGMEMDHAGMSPMEAFEQWSASPDAQHVSPEQMEQYREMAEQFRPENQNYDTTAATRFETLNPPPPPGGTPPPVTEVLVAMHDHNSDGIPDEYHYDTNGDGIADHAHPTPH